MKIRRDLRTAFCARVCYFGWYVRIFWYIFFGWSPAPASEVFPYVYGKAPAWGLMGKEVEGEGGGRAKMEQAGHHLLWIIAVVFF